MAYPIKNYIQIRIKGLPSKWKDISFEDRKYIKEIRLLPLENETTAYKTDEWFKSTDYPNIFIDLKIATITYERKMLQILYTENVEISEIEAAEELLIIDTDGIYYQCEVEGIERVETEKTTLYLTNITCKIIYKYDDTDTDKSDILSENKYNDFATSNYLLSKYEANKLWTLHIKNYENIDDSDLTTGFYFYTKIYPKLNRTESKVDTTPLGNTNIVVNKINSWQEINCRFYLTETERNNLKKYAPVCHYKLSVAGDSFGTTLYNLNTGNIYKSEKPMEIEFVDNDKLNNLGIYEVNVKLFTDKLNYSPFLNRIPL